MSKHVYSTGWLCRDRDDCGEFMFRNAKFAYCAWGIQQYFDVPNNATKVRFTVFLRPGVKRFEFKSYLCVMSWVRLQVRLIRLRRIVSDEEDRITVFADVEHDREFIKRHNRLIDRTLYVECEYD
jgi:hypothetical protein